MDVSRKSQSLSPIPTPESVAAVVLTAVAEALARLQAAAGGVQPLRVGVALSGGLDSVVLLHAVVALRATAAAPFMLSAVHVHHGLSPNADAWSAFCSQLCSDWQVPLTTCRVEVPLASGEGLEGAARRVRHACFARLSCDWLLLAQHRSDQAETVLLNLLRGAGVSGAAAMPVVRRPKAAGAGPGLLRPLLDVPRSRLVAYAEYHGLPWVEDESNVDTAFRRNFLRHEILPRLGGPFPGAEAALARAARQFGEAAELLDQLAELDREASAGRTGRVAVSAFNALPAARARNLLRFLWAAAGFRAPERRWVDEALAQLATAKPDSETCVATADGALHVYRGELYVVRPELSVPDEFVWSGEPVVGWGGGCVRFVTAEGGIPVERLTAGAVVLRCRQGGERLRPAPGRPRRSLRNLLQEGGVPPWERAGLPYLWLDDELAWVGRVGLNADVGAGGDGVGIAPLWEPAR